MGGVNLELILLATGTVKAVAAGPASGTDTHPTGTMTTEARNDWRGDLVGPCVGEQSRNGDRIGELSRIGVRLRWGVECRSGEQSRSGDRSRNGERSRCDEDGVPKLHIFTASVFVGMCGAERADQRSPDGERSRPAAGGTPE